MKLGQRDNFKIALKDGSSRLCPSCLRGAVNDRGVCERCGVGVPKTLEVTILLGKGRTLPKKTDQSYEGPLTDYVRTKEDKS